MPQAKVGGANRRDERRTRLAFAKATAPRAVPAKAPALEQLPHDRRMRVVDGADDGGEAVILVGAPAGEEVRGEKRLDPTVERRPLASRRSGPAAGAMERLAD